MSNALELVQIAASAAFDKKALRISALDVKGLSDLCDVTLICSAENEKHAAAIAEAIEEKCKRIAGVKAFAVEGKQIGNWVLMDYGYLVVHVFLNTIRDYYALDTLWPKANKIAVEGSLTQTSPLK
jgi:ribosome-associated protein